MQVTYPSNGWHFLCVSGTVHFTETADGSMSSPIFTDCDQTKPTSDHSELRCRAQLASAWARLWVTAFLTPCLKCSLGPCRHCSWNGIFRVIDTGSRHSSDSASIREAVTRLGLRSRYSSVCTRRGRPEQKPSAYVDWSGTSGQHWGHYKEAPLKLWMERSLAGLRHGGTNVPTWVCRGWREGGISESSQETYREHESDINLPAPNLQYATFTIIA